MAGILERFQKNIVGSRGRIADYASTISAKGDFRRSTDLDVILNSWKNILLTPLRSVSHDPTYGSDLYKYIFDLADPETIESITEEIEYSLMSYDDRATITNIDVKILPNMKGLNITIHCQYEGEVGEMSTTVDIGSSNFLGS